MDAKTAVEVLGNKCGDCVMLAIHEATEINALIERQVTKIQQQEKYAGLGRLAIEVLKKLEFSDSGSCFFCYETSYDGHNRACQMNSLLKSAELLAEKKPPKVCTACNGSGYYDAKGSPKCGACEGSGLE